MSEDPIPYESLKQCPRCTNVFLFNIETGEYVRARCKSYKCPYCGVKKVKHLYHAIYQYVQTWKRVRMWTFTFNANIFNNMDLSYRLNLASKIWKDFLDVVRRSSNLTKYDRKFQFIKVLELQGNGSPHYHCLIDRFVPWRTVYDCWHQAIRKNTKWVGALGTVSMSGGISKKDGARYVTKYVLKTLESLPTNITARRWSKSNSVSIFAKEKEPGWICFILNLSSLSITSTIEIFMENQRRVNLAPKSLYFPDLPEPALKSAKILTYGND